MEFPLTPQDEAAILRQYEKNMSRYPAARTDVDSFLRETDETVSLCMKYLYGHMAAQDVLSNPPETFFGYVLATLEALREIGYLKTVPPEVFFPYVLYHRVNSETLDGSRSFLLAQLLPLVRGKSMDRAALCVNYWCYAHATYTPADDRTLSPMAVLRRTLGRCGEESVLAVAALRSAGIPARQCYCPRWSHCDDNHAWVEVWVDGRWHYLGACEPEPVLDRGWFTAAASRAMLVDTKCWGHQKSDSLYQIVNCTARYADTRILTVRVTDGSLPVPDARVLFQVVNYSQLYTLWETTADAAGFARFETAPGDLFVCAQSGGKTALKKVDLRQQQSITLALADSFPAQITADLVPPEDSSGVVPFADSPIHPERLRLCENHLSARRASFAENEGYLQHAGLNAPEIRIFLEDPRYPLFQKEELLSTLRPKDFVDITRETLEDALEAANTVRGFYPPDIFRNYILSPRIADEMLLPERQNIRSLFPQGFTDPGEIHTWMQANMERLPDVGICNYYPSAWGCLRFRQVPSFAFDMVFVALCRSFCFPARLEPHTGHAQWLGPEGRWHGIRPESPPIALTLEIPDGKRLNYGEHLTLGLWNGRDFDTLTYGNLTVEGRRTFTLPPGLYRITATTRQIDGTASVAIRHLTLSHSQALTITPPGDQTAMRLKQIPLALPAGALQRVLDSAPGRKHILIFADPGSEPTEHLLREILEMAADYLRLPCRLLLLTETREAHKHPTVQLLKTALPETELHCLRDPDALSALHRQMQVGDLRLPFVVCTDIQGRGVYADANYRIGLAQTLFKIQSVPDAPAFR